MLRAIAILLGLADYELKAKKIAEITSFHLVGTIERLEKVVDSFTAIPPQLAAMATATETLKKNADDITQLRTTMAETDLTRSPSNPPTNSRSYSSVVQQNAPIPAPVSAALLRAAIKDRQILLEPIVGGSIFEPNENPADIAKKFQQTLSTIQSNDSPDLQIKATTRLRNGGLIIELTTAEAANWIRSPENKVKLTEKLDSQFSIKTRRFSIIVPFLSVTADVENGPWLRAIETENSLSTGSIEAAGWIKPKNRRATDQRVAHAIFHFSDPTAANSTLRDGIYINQEKLHPRKDKREPVRCVKCQLWGHVAKDCNALKDVCGTCGKNHRTDTCNAYRTFFCVSCNSQDHASWNRNCPEFENRCAGIDAKLPENSMPYFPTDEDWTQVMLPPKPAPYRKPAEQPIIEQRPTFRQTNLTFETNPTTDNRRFYGRPSRGTPGYHGHSRPRTFTPTSSNSIPIPMGWGSNYPAPPTQQPPTPPTSKEPGTAKPTPPQHPPMSPSPSSQSTSNSSNPRTPTPPHV